MKKFSIFGIIILLVMVSCNNFSDLGSTDDPIQYTADGRPMVAVSLGTGSSGRALTDYLAKNGFDLYEAVFKDPAPPAGASTYYRKTWAKGEAAKIYLPTGGYATSANAILLAGASKDKTLLAVGTITGVTDTADVTSPGATITTTTKSITFTIYSLETDINKTYAAATSTFAILTPAASATVAGTLPTVDGYPYFAVPYSNSATTLVTANYTLFCASGGNFSDYIAGLFLKAVPTITSAGIPSADDHFIPIAVTAASFTSLTTVDTTIPAVTLPVSFTVPMSLKPGLSKIWIDIPVYGLNNSVTGITWHIRGGFSNSVIDGGKANNSLGGAILIGIGNIDGITISPNYP